MLLVTMLLTITVGLEMCTRRVGSMGVAITTVSAGTASIVACMAAALVLLVPRFGSEAGGGARCVSGLDMCHCLPPTWLPQGHAAWPCAWASPQVPRRPRHTATVTWETRKAATSPVFVPAGLGSAAGSSPWPVSACPVGGACGRPAPGSLAKVWAHPHRSACAAQAAGEDARLH